MTARQVELVQLYTESTRLASLWALTRQLQEAVDALDAEIKRTIHDPAWMTAHFAETEERHRHAGDEQ